MSKLERVVEDLIFYKDELELTKGRVHLLESDETRKKILRELIDFGLLEKDNFESDYEPPSSIMVRQLTPLGCKLIKLSKDKEKWEKVKKGDTSVIDDDDLKKFVKKLMPPSPP